MSNSVTPWTVARQVLVSVGFSRREYWSGLTFPPPGDLPHPGIEPRPPVLQAGSLPSEAPPNTMDRTKFHCSLKFSLHFHSIEF